MSADNSSLSTILLLFYMRLVEGTVKVAVLVKSVIIGRSFPHDDAMLWPCVRPSVSVCL